SRRRAHEFAAGSARNALQTGGSRPSLPAVCGASCLLPACLLRASGGEGGIATRASHGPLPDGHPIATGSVRGVMPVTCVLHAYCMPIHCVFTFDLQAVNRPLDVGFRLRETGRQQTFPNHRARSKQESPRLSANNAPGCVSPPWGADRVSLAIIR